MNNFDLLASSATAGDFFADFFANPDLLSSVAATVVPTGGDNFELGGDGDGDVDGALVLLGAQPVFDDLAGLTADEFALLPHDTQRHQQQHEQQHEQEYYDNDDEDYNASETMALSSGTACMSECGNNSKRKRRAKVPVPESVKATPAYQERRRKNNMAAARNREMKRQQARQEHSKLPALDARKMELQNECELLRAELATLKTRLVQRLARL